LRRSAAEIESSGLPGRAWAANVRSLLSAVSTATGRSLLQAAASARAGARTYME
jgi:hypothetical protein